MRDTRRITQVALHGTFSPNRLSARQLLTMGSKMGQSHHSFFFKKMVMQK